MRSSCVKQYVGLLLLTLAIVKLSISEAPEEASATYRAGVVEFQPPPPAPTQQETVLNNAKLYGEYAARAAEMGVQILVFPEYGLVTFNDLDERESVAGYLQDVPDPKLHEWNPCEEPDKYKNTQALHELSCAARNNSVVIVANLLSKEPCDIENHLDQSSDSANCPQDGHYQFNTNIIFAQNGTLLARYHKRHLYEEESYTDPAPQPEYVILDLGFVRIATFICFDLLYDKPTVELVEKHGIRNIAFPTAWENQLPYLMAPQVISSIAYGLGINILAANFFHLDSGGVGSGIFSSTRGALNGTWDISTPGRLIIADVPVEPSNIIAADESSTCYVPDSSESITEAEALKVPPYIITDQPSTKLVNKTHRIYYQSLGNFSSTLLTEMQGNVTGVCQGSLCCSLEYKFAKRDPGDAYRLVANSGLTPGDYSLGMEICSVLRCENEKDVETCGRVQDPIHASSTSFETLVLRGRFQSNHLYPSVLSTDLSLVNTNKWLLSKRECTDSSGSRPNSYTVGNLTITTPIEKPLLEACIMARVYDWDVE